jgi:hypothetical protein
MPRFEDPTVKAAFDAHPRGVRARLMTLRQLILDTAASTEGVGRLQETLKWGQPSYLTPETKSGTTVRIDALKDGGSVAIYVHCRTGLVEGFRSRYPELRYEGNRAIVFRATDDIPPDAVRHCVAMALTYHRDKRRGT